MLLRSKKFTTIEKFHYHTAVLLQPKHFTNTWRFYPYLMVLYQVFILLKRDDSATK